jgi:hypothetical protein
MARFSDRLVPKTVQVFWAAIPRGEFVTAAAAEAGTYREKGTRWLIAESGIRPRRGRDLKGRCLTFVEREEIALARAGGESDALDRAATGAQPVDDQPRARRTTNAGLRWPGSLCRARDAPLPNVFARPSASETASERSGHRQSDVGGDLRRPLGICVCDANAVSARSTVHLGRRAPRPDARAGLARASETTDGDMGRGEKFGAGASGGCCGPLCSAIESRYG